MMWDNTLTQLFHKGGVCMWPLLACSIIGLAIILERSAVALWLHTNYRLLVERFESLLRTGRIDEARRQLRGFRSPVAHIIRVYLAHIETPAVVREEILGREGSEQVARLERRMNWLGTIASIATLLGLLGTVTGLVSAFHQIELSGGQVQPGDLAAGIWEALITTVFGLVIAIPCMTAYQLLDHWAGSVGVQMQWIKAHLDEWLHNEPGTSAPAGPELRVAESRPAGKLREDVVQIGVRTE